MDEVQLLVGAAAEAAAGRGRALWVQGEPGIGKSALVAAGLADTRGRGCQVYTGAAQALLPTFPLQVMLEALRLTLDLAGTDPVGDGPGGDAARATRAEIGRLMRGEGSGSLTPWDTAGVVAEQVLVLVDRLCGAAPVVLVLDDVQWADDASLGLWLRLGRAVAQLPLLLVAAGRPVPERAEVDTVRRGLVDAGAMTIDLGPLTPAQVVEMVHRRVGSAPGPALARQMSDAGGNPLYVQELVDALHRDGRIKIDAGTAELISQPGQVPASLPAAIRTRLNFLSESTIATLHLAALVGPVFSMVDLSTVAGRPATHLLGAVNEALAAGVLVDVPPGLAFRHGLVHQTLYEGSPESVRAALHRQAAQALAEAGAPVDRVAEQLLAAPVPADPWMIEWVASAASALTHRAPQTAVQLIERVRGAVGPGPQREALTADLATAHFHLGHNERVEQLARPALTTARQPDVLGRTAWTLGYALLRLGRYQQAIEVTDQALTRTELTDVWRARLRALGAMSLLNVDRPDQAEAAAQRAEEEGRRAGDALAVGYALHSFSMVMAHYRSDWAAGLEIIDRALAVLGDENQATDLRLLLHGNRAAYLNNLGRVADADNAVAQAIVLAERSSTMTRLSQLRVTSAEMRFCLGRWDEALAELQAAADLPLDIAGRLLQRGFAAMIAVHRDDRATTAGLLHGVDDLTSAVGEVRDMAEYLLVAGALSAERDGQPEQALTRLLAIFDPQNTRQFAQLTPDSALWLPDTVRLALGLGDNSVATAAAHACAAEAKRQARPPTTASDQHCQGLIDSDPAPLLAAADGFRRIDYPLFAAHALESAAVLYAEQGDLSAARTAYTQAIETYIDLDAAWDIMRADIRLRPHNIRRGARGPRRRPTTGWAALTPTEIKIAHLVAAGQSNPDIAAELFLSRRTVETHVQHILAKLDARSRFAIAHHAATAS